MSDILGIMTHRIGHAGSFARHAKSALAEKFSGILVYTPKDVNLTTRRITGYVYKGGTWSRQTMPFPRMNMDIGFYKGSQVARATLVKKAPSFPFTGYGIGNKIRIQSHLLTSPVLKPYLLPTELVKDSSSFLAFVKKYNSVMLKPINGWGGRDIVRVTLEQGQYKVQKNGEQTRLTSAVGIRSLIRRALSKERQIMQQWIDIRNKQGIIYDIRALMLKKSEGNWETTGIAVREAQRGRITSNLKSGGHAFEASSYLKKEFGDEKGEALAKSVRELAEYIPTFTEKSYGARLCELGIDLAVDVHGKLWLLEINIKPGKKIMRQLYGLKAWEQCLHTHFQYARSLLSKTQ
ncbi:YheC/YheD family endospore coat-associated protein [Paenibacillus glycanilyticus]|uniref:YheC/YheD family endospore coat-associated protein n=1 Tax=Paenibacillus glycanilyticus TaxID=126569 RepID=UPI001910960A|nr:YheC/YheD family protein [Paenibacillus glycanilyticus]